MFIEKYEELKKALNENQSLLVRNFSVSRRSLGDIGKLTRRGLVYYSSELCQGFTCPLHCCSRDIKFMQENRGDLTDTELDELVEILKAPPILYLNSNSNGPKQFDFADRLMYSGVRFSFSVIRKTYKVTRKQWATDYKTIASEDVISFENFDEDDKRASGRHCDLYEKWLKSKLKLKDGSEI